MADPFHGVWVLDPSTADYGDRPVPREAVYTIFPDGPGLGFHIRWTDGAGARQEAAFAVQPDGPPVPLPDGQTLVCTRPAPDRLDTEVLRDGEVVHGGYRTRTEAGLHVVQTDPDGRTEALYRFSPVKQVMVYRRDLKMRKGKIAAQCAHASLKVFMDRDTAGGARLDIPMTPAMTLWARTRFAKVVLAVNSEEDLVRAHTLARERGLPTTLITDSGRTEFHGVPTRTTVAIGPAAAVDIDPITGREGLVPTQLA